MKKYFLLAALIVLNLTSVSAQIDLSNYSLHYNRKQAHFQRWMSQKGLSTILSIDTIKLAKNGEELELWLTMNTENPDTAAFLWQSLERTYAKANPSQRISELLFRTFVRFMEVPAEQANVQIYSPLSLDRNLGYSPCFRVWIWEEEEQLETDIVLDGCKSSNTVNFPIIIKTINTESSSGNLQIHRGQDVRYVLDRILIFVKQKYVPNNLHSERTEEYPKIEQVQVESARLDFVVADLYREVLTEERRSIWCSIVDLIWGPCNDMRRERLYFSIEYIPKPTGYQLDFTITGKYGSGDFVPRENDYLDMAPDFEEKFLIPYLRDFKLEVKEYLEE